MYQYQENTVLSVLLNHRTILSLENILFCEDDNVDLHIHYTVNVIIVSYFGTKLSEIKEIDG